MDKKSFEFFEGLMAIPSVSGCESEAANFVSDWLKPHVDKIERDVHGNTSYILNPEGSPRVMISTHIDQIGFLVSNITEKGYVYLAAVGGIDTSILQGSKLIIHGDNGPVLGLVGKKAIHLMKPEERESNKKVELVDLFVDIGARSREEAAKKVKIGDPVTFLLGATRLGDTDIVTAAALDNRSSVWVMAEVMRRIGSDKAKRKQLKAAVYGVATVQEEIGLRGAITATFGIKPDVGIAIDVCHGTDYPGADDRLNGTVTLGGGPTLSHGPNINKKLNLMLDKAAKKADVTIQNQAAPRGTGTDANAIQISRGGVAAALVSLPCRYMHTPVEVVSTKDMVAAADMLVEFLLKLSPDASFIP